MNKVKELWNKTQEVVVDFIRGTWDDITDVWEFRPNVIILLVTLSCLCLLV